MLAEANNSVVLSRFPVAGALFLLDETVYAYICAIGVSHTACKHEFRRKLQSHSWIVFFFIIY